MATPVHRCYAHGCQQHVPPRLFMCKRHWQQLPKELRDTLWRAYVPGQEVSGCPSEDYIAAARAAIAYVHDLEVAASTTPLALFDRAHKKEQSCREKPRKSVKTPSAAAGRRSRSTPPSPP